MQIWISDGQKKNYIRDSSVTIDVPLDSSI